MRTFNFFINDKRIVAGLNVPTHTTRNGGIIRLPTLVSAIDFHYVQAVSDAPEAKLVGSGSRHDHASSALRDGWRLNNEIVKVVAADFLL